MRDYGTVIRKAYFDALKNAIVIEGSTIPVFDEKHEVGNSELYIKISSQDMQQQNTKCHFRAKCVIRLQVTELTKTVGSKLKSDQVSDLILTTLYPTKKTNILDIDPPFQLVTSVLDGTDTFFDKTQTGYTQGKLLYFSNTINQS